MDHKLQTVFALIALISILIPDLTEGTETCQGLFDNDNYLNFTSRLKEIANCSDDHVRSLEAEKQGELLQLLTNAAEQLKSTRMKACRDVHPKNCSFPLIPRNGGLICLTHEKTRYCKPMCNQGYDFAFLRRLRLFESCGDGNGYRWTTQYIGGNRLAVCSESSQQVSGVETAYFPQSCLDAIYNHTEEKVLISIFKEELKKFSVDKVNSKTKCLLCGN